MQENILVEEINQLLKGCHMGANLFQQYREKIKSEELHGVYDEIIDNLSLHEKALSALVISEHGEPKDSAGAMGSLTNFMYSFKNMQLASDLEVLEDSVKAMDMAIKAIQDFDESHDPQKPDLRKTIRIMRDDYKTMYHMLHKYMIEYEQ